MFRLIIVEDEAILRKGICNIIDWTSLGFQLEGDFANAPEALAFFREHPVDLVVTDIKMPEMNGYEATSEIRKSSADIPIIAVTAYAFTEDEKRILENGFNGYLSKPIKAQTLLQKIKEFLN